MASHHCLNILFLLISWSKVVIITAQHHHNFTIFNWAILRPHFLYFVFSIKSIAYLILPTTGFEPRISGVGNDRSTSWATTTTVMTSFWTSLSERLFWAKRRQFKLQRFHFCASLSDGIKLRWKWILATHALHPHTRQHSKFESSKRKIGFEIWLP